MKRVLIILLVFIALQIYAEKKQYQVKYGDTLYSIALNHKTTIDQIVADNNIIDKKITVGQTLNIKLNSIDRYIVQQGDTLSDIALKKNISLKRLLQLNRIDNNHILREGDKLTVPVKPEDKKIYTVQKGDTLSWISIAYNIDQDELIKINKLKDKEIKIGQKINLIEKKPETKIAALSLPENLITKKKTNTVEYVVKKGDTLMGISRKFKCSINSIKEQNNLTNDTISINQKLNIPAKLETYSVKKGDTLLEIAIKNNTTTEELIKLNSLNSEKIKINQKIKLPWKKEKLKVQKQISHTVKSGETLSAIALEYQTTVKDIIKENKLDNYKIILNQKLLMPDYAKKRAPIDYYIYHTVTKGETLSEISYKYDISETLLRELNNLTGDIINIGDKLKLIPQNSRTHKVEKGDTLWAIAKKYNVSVDQLMQYNHLNTTKVEIGKKINIYDYRVVEHIASGNIKTSKVKEKTSVTLASYSFGNNNIESQLYRAYTVDELTNPIQKYKLAVKKWNQFDKSIIKEKTISNILDGWTIILDPGHGGKDPGAIATVKTGNTKLHIVEDEYAYDTTLRLYELLKRNGAEVYMTILSPDHLTRNPSNNTNTFINEKNEVYNNHSLNKINNKTVWPVGGQWGLNQRVTITNNILKNKKGTKTLFLSVHADNDIDRGKGKLILYHSNGHTEDSKSKLFANSMIKTMGSDATIKPMDLAVLRGNKSDYKVLIELKNMAHLSEALDLIDKHKRQEDAKMILEGIKRYIKDHK